MDKPYVVDLQKVGIEDVAEVGGKNASLGEMLQTLTKKGVNVPGGYAVTATAYRYFLSETGLRDVIVKELEGLDTRNLPDLSKRAEKIRDKINQTDFPKELENAIREQQKKTEQKYGKLSDFAVRSSATAEDLPDASFAGEHETYLNVRGVEYILKSVRMAMASLFTDRAISYRVDKGFDHFSIALSVGVQKMVRSDMGCSGVMFTLDTESGFKNVVLINGSWGLGEMVVQGHVTPDEYMVFKEPLLTKSTTLKPIIEKSLGSKLVKMVYSSDKSKPTVVVDTTHKERSEFVLTDAQILQLAKWGVEIEEHYSQRHSKWTPMDTEWAKDGQTGELFIVQARPETIHSTRDYSKIKEYVRVQNGKALVTGSSVGSKIACGKVHIILDTKDINKFKAGEVLVTEMTDPDWEPIMKIASAIVTDKGGRTSHAAIVSRELGIPAIVGCKNATAILKTGQQVTVDTTGEEGEVFAGSLKFKVIEHDTSKLPKTRTHIMLNIATPETSFAKSFLPNGGVGLAREEFIASSIGIHPMALINYSTIPHDVKLMIDQKTSGYDDKSQYFIDKLAFGVAKIATAFYPKSVILRFSDFKTNEYRSLIGGHLYEPQEENPMIGWRGASRYYHTEFVKAFILEVKAIKKVREEMGLTNLEVMVPFCRTVEEGQKVIKIMEEHGLSRKRDHSLKIYVMCEIPSNVLLAEQFLEIFDGMSIGSNDLTQLTLGIDRDGNDRIKGISNENDLAVKSLIAHVIKVCKSKNKYIGICGQAPSDYPEFAQFLVKAGIDSMSLNPDVVIETTLKVFEEEQRSH